MVTVLISGVKMSLSWVKVAHADMEVEEVCRREAEIICEWL